ncbi:MAG TPA: hypothetical protein VF912_03890 [Anaeromyxobacter sp.]
MRRAVWVAVAMSAALEGCTSVPDHTNPWLGYKYGSSCLTGTVSDCFDALRDTNVAWSYYTALGVEDPDHYELGNWLGDYGFPPNGVDAHAIYANLADLQFGRDMNCVQSGQKTSCYVVNYGPPPFGPGSGSWPDVTGALHDALNFGTPFGTVAMVYDAARSEPNQVSFFAFGDKEEATADGGTFTRHNALLYSAALDSEGLKSVPRMCMACHGGTYDTSSNTATGAKFLPFDVFSFRYPNEAGYSFDEQQEALRKLNAAVAETNPGSPFET